MESPNSNIHSREGEISLREVILRLQGWLKYLLSKWPVIMLFVLFGASVGLIYALNSKPEYTAELTFVLEDNQSTTLGAYAGLANQFGIDLSGGSGSGIFSGENIMEFLKSRLMIEKALLTPIVLNGKLESLADYYLDLTNTKKNWKGNPALEGLHFPADLNKRKFTLQHDSILSIIYKNIVNDNLIISKPDKKLSFISVKCTTTDEIFSKKFTERLVKEATDFYIQTKLQRSKVTVDKLQMKADSIELLLNRKTYSLAESQDLNLNPARSMAGVRTELAARDKLVLQTIFGEVVKNLELSKMAMAQETPIIQIVDRPVLPLKKNQTGIIKGIVIGGFLAGFATVFVLMLKRTYKLIMNNL